MKPEVWSQRRLLSSVGSLQAEDFGPVVSWGCDGERRLPESSRHRTGRGSGPLQGSPGLRFYLLKEDELSIVRETIGAAGTSWFWISAVHHQQNHRRKRRNRFGPNKTWITGTTFPSVWSGCDVQLQPKLHQNKSCGSVCQFLRLLLCRTNSTPPQERRGLLTCSRWSPGSRRCGRGTPTAGRRSARPTSAALRPGCRWTPPGKTPPTAGGRCRPAGARKSSVTPQYEESQINAKPSKWTFFTIKVNHFKI